MTEHIQRRQEKSLPELEALQTLSLYSNDEIKKIISRRSDFEYKVARRDTQRSNFVSYIDYEINLLEDIRLRRIKFKIDTNKNQIENILIKRIIDLYERALQRFSTDKTLWFSLIAFTSQANYNVKTSEAIKKMTESLPKDPEVWKAAVVWNSKRDTYENTRKLVLRGIHFNPKSVILYREAFLLELSTKPQKVEAALVIFSSAEKVINDPNEMCSFLIIADEFEKTGVIQHNIIKQLKSQFSNDVKLWQILGQRELDGKHFSPLSPVAIEYEHSPSKKIENSIAVFTEALEILPNFEMWNCYLDTITTCPFVSSSTQYSILKECYDLSKSKNVNYMNEKNYIKLVDLTEDNIEKETILINAVKYLPESEILWCEYLCFYIKKNDKDLIEKTFQKGVKVLNKKSIVLWKLMLKYYSIPSEKDNYHEIEKLYKEGIKYPCEEVSDYLKINYLEWLIIVKDQAAVRDVFKMLIKQGRPSIDFFRKMLEIEITSVRPNNVVINTIFQNSILHYGRTHIDVWIDQIKYQMRTEPAKVSITVAEAQKNLAKHLLNEFNLKYDTIRLSEECL